MTGRFVSITTGGRILKYIPIKHTLSCAALALVTTGVAVAADKVTIKLAQAYPTSLAVIGKAPAGMAKKLATASGGTLQIEIYEPGALVPVLETFDVVSKGAVDAGYTAGTFWAGKDVTFNMYSAIPFGPATDEYLAWMYHGGGLELQDELYAGYNLKSILCGVVTPEAAGWFRSEINSVDDLKGLKMRFAGMGAQVIGKLGVSTQLIAPSEIYTALDRGVIDATEFSTPAADLSLGFDEAAKHYYFPGWHQQSAFAQLLINLDKWNALSDAHKTLLSMGCNDAITVTLAEGEAVQGPALQQLQEKGVMLHTLSPQILDALAAAWQEVSAEVAGQNAEFKKAWDSYSAFRENYAVWKQRGYLQ
jgi:TRAP-type mannitol/chloroaromatic compound transport system substrate-binding protein